MLFVYRFGPGRLEPLGHSAVPGKGAGFEIAQYIIPVVVSIAGVYQQPPPEFTSGWPQRSGESTVLTFHRTAPVAWSRP